MKKIYLILFLCATINLAQSQNDKAPYIGYMIIQSSPSVDSVVYISELYTCNLPTNNSEINSEKYRIGDHFRTFVKAKYNLEKPTGTSDVWMPLRMEKTTTEQYNGAIVLYKKTHEVIIINDPDYQCNCDVY